MKRYILVRHVETQGNVEGRLNGHTESHYTKRGLMMKERLLEEIQAIHQHTPINRVYASPISRARIIGEEASAILGVPFSVEPVLKEFNFGIFDGLTIAEAEVKDPAAWKEWMEDYNFTMLPEGESYVEYHRRLKHFIEEEDKEEEDQTVLIVAHGGTVHSLLLNLLDLPLDVKWHFEIKLGGIAIIRCPEGYGILETLYAPEYE